MWLAILGLLNGIIVGLIYSVEELWFGIFFALVPFAGIIFTRKKISGFLAGYGLGYYITGLSFLFKLADIVPLPVYTANVLFAVAILAISVCLTFFMWLALAPFQFLRRGGGCDIFWLAGLYALGEWFQGIVPAISFPWFRLAAVAAPAPIFIQGASVFGGIFVSFLIVLWNALLAKMLFRRRIDRGICLAGALIIAMLLYGEVRLYQNETTSKQVLIVQGNHEGGEKWAMQSEDILEDYKRLVYEYADSPIDLVVLPETALPYSLTDNRNTRRTLITVSRQLKTEILLGAIQSRETESGEMEYYNAVYHVTEDGIDEAVYRKQVLVPFGEYLPYEQVLGKLFPWLPEFMSGNYFAAGTEQVVFDTGAGKVGALICYESVFPGIAREAVRQGAQMLVLVSNDSWFQDTPAMREHHAHAVLRAVEEGRYVIRAGNTGISSVIDSRGRVVAGMPENVSGGFQANARPCTEITIYAGIGDIFPAVLCVIYVLLLFWRVCILIFFVFSDIISRQYE